MGILERINGARIITVSFFENPNEYGHIGYIDFVDARWDKPRHRFANIALKDWEQNIESQVISIKVMLKEALMNGILIDIIIERRKNDSKEFDYLIKIDNLVAFQE